MIKSVLKFGLQRFRAFRADEDGAVTTDFVVLTASVMMMGAAHIKDVADGANNMAGDIEGCLGQDIATLLVDGDPETYMANLQAASQACSSR